MIRSVATISENSQPTMRPRSSAYICCQPMTSRQRMDEDVEPEIGRRPPERAQRFGVERLSLQLGADDHAGKAEIDGAALQLGRGFGGLERRHMAQAR